MSSRRTQSIARRQAAVQAAEGRVHERCCPDDKVQRYLVYLKYCTLNLKPLMVYPTVQLPPNFIIKALLYANLSLWARCFFTSGSVLGTCLAMRIAVSIGRLVVNLVCLIGVQAVAYPEQIWLPNPSPEHASCCGSAGGPETHSPV